MAFSLSHTCVSTLNNFNSTMSLILSMEPIQATVIDFYSKLQRAGCKAFATGATSRALLSTATQLLLLHHHQCCSTIQHRLGALPPSATAPPSHPTVRQSLRSLLLPQLLPWPIAATARGLLRVCYCQCQDQCYCLDQPQHWVLLLPECYYTTTSAELSI